MSPLHVETPLLESRPLSEALGAPVWLKLESLQPVASFKIRGIGHAAERAVASGARRLVTSSGGNAGYALAHAGRRLGVAVTVVVPVTTSAHARALIEGEGAEVVRHGASWDDAHEAATALADDPGCAYVHPFDDPLVWEGHASLVQEVARAGLRPGVVVVSVGGGGLLCGVLQGMHAVGWSDVPVLAVETVGAASFKAAVDSGRVVTLERIDSLAVTLGARAVTPELLAWTERHAMTPWTVTDAAAVKACARFLDDHRLLVEPACGAALAAVHERAAPLARRAPVLVVACGGAGVSRELLSRWERATSG